MTPDPHAVERAAQGDRAAFAGLYDAWSAPLYAYLVGLLRRREEAEDALHDAFLTAWTRLPGLREAERFVPWLFRIAKNAALSLRRRPRHGPLVAEPAGRADEHGDDAAASMLADLEPDTRAVLLLRFVVGWSVDATAEALDASAATVKRLTARGLDVLRARLERSRP